ncbi:ABC transporter substrate-binding protein [Candidatus Entotheonella palauensis]|uniref:ABC transporter substrate-binding protein n=1 Tax=Candidatus Entotheonella palauensis TaxID=93172 RepID=UPI0015C4E523|nr:ABC transporter substrate-binding protein [Candidatus Entotheonella palauensis]
MKICSLLPSGTEIVYALGLGDHLVGVSDLCDYPPEATSQPVISRSRIDTEVLSSAEVEAAMRALMERGESPFHIDADGLLRNPPDLVLTQDTCAICDAAADDVQRALKGIQPEPELLVLNPRTVADILASIIAVGAAAGVPQRADQLVGELESRIRAVTSAISQVQSRPRLMSLEGVNPMVAGGHWIPELKILAGGRDDLFSPGCAAQRLEWATVRDYDPEILLITPCSSGLERSMRELDHLAEHDGWWDLQAVRAREVYVIDHVYFSRPGPRIVDGLELLAQIVHPSCLSGMIPDGSVLKLGLAPGKTCPPAELADAFVPYPGVLV